MRRQENSISILISTVIPTLVMFIAILPGCQPNSSNSSNAKELRKNLEFLASDSLEGRETGFAGAEKAASFLVEKFTALGLDPAGEDGTYVQQFDFVPHPPIQEHVNDDGKSLGMAVVKKLNSVNVMGMLNKGAEETIILGAHYDHVGWGAQNSFHTGDPQIHNGADDNASGVTALLELIARLKNQELRHNILFICFSGEEKGLYGSNFFCDNPTIDLGKVECMLNMDMVGRLKDSNALAVNGAGTSPVWEEVVDSCNADSLNLVYSDSGVGPSDHTSFYLEDLPVLHFFTGQHEDYHKPSDDADKINFDGILKVVGLIERVTVKLNDYQNMEFTKTKDSESESTPAFNVTLGVIPDYLFDGEGMRIDGVSEEKPAHNAGIIAGDVVVQMGDHVVTDMQTYMEGLSMWEKGDTTTVIVNRDGTRKPFLVNW
ncbi:MAG: M20/M25/M40 family metallo-hydrolase [Flavobacteriales bacterium]|nr:M20/M25/M40 family metallo-hydrolase [Flavobacteriales bacterium]MDG1780148.1 M20/M25/M40 family metallo-hydrolase [Flavobacteriales bacterium]MDG2247063.1 M20/M25/M40 family metallo-hydrolase [Flavobacteriales bacterium]